VTGKTTPKREVAVERVVQFKTSDGASHDTYAAALRHEHTLELGKWLDDWSYREAPDGKALAAAIKEAWTVSRRKDK
jgi:hypothetical protein